MVQLTGERRAEVERLCRRSGVLRLDLFGSGADPRRFRADSDLDFVVEFDPALRSGRADAYFDLLFGLQDLFGRRVDLVMRSAIDNRNFLQTVEQGREPLYAA